MPTLLVTRKMSPELAARVQASVEGRRRAQGARLAPGGRAVLRIVAITLIVAALVEAGLAVRRAHRELEQERATLLQRVRDASAAISPREREVTRRIKPWLVRFDGAYAGDHVDDALRADGALARAVAQPTIYVRGSLGQLATDATESYPDAFVLCLVDPPPARTEKELRIKARAAFTASGMQPAHNVFRYADALIGLPLLAPGWAARVAATDDRGELDALRRSFERAPIEAAKRAAKARQLLIVVDEPGASTGLSELDGERPHDVRVGLVDLERGKTLLRLRRHVDPSWASGATRAELAKGIDSCSLALDVRSAVGAGPAVASP